MTFTDEQREWLDANEREFKGNKQGEWAYSENAQPIIDEMIEAGLIRFISGKFVSAPAADPPEEVHLLGHVLPIVGKMISLCQLTPYGKSAREAKP